MCAAVEHSAPAAAPVANVLGEATSSKATLLWLMPGDVAEEWEQDGSRAASAAEEEPPGDHSTKHVVRGVKSVAGALTARDTCKAQLRALRQAHNQPAIVRAADSDPSSRPPIRMQAGAHGDAVKFADTVQRRSSPAANATWLRTKVLQHVIALPLATSQQVYLADVKGDSPVPLPEQLLDRIYGSREVR